ncbi:MAG TPA: hypothetical protein VFO70_05880 [Chitinophagaceae bacterium]|nr:hypothetical protein [Chitinophagaceae bacterium]
MVETTCVVNGFDFSPNRSHEKALDNFVIADLLVGKAIPGGSYKNQQQAAARASSIY